ncbi:MAG: HupE/UreJ family protein [Verrucomicrobiaceae bacterium]|nr:HupE/UreJ family protein [Verrucomicrobiaceae bacterium]
MQITVVTIAHSLTLGLSLYGVSVPARVVEVAIALSIAFIAVESLFRDRLSRWRPLVVFAFGLIHGLGFAHTFQKAAVDRDAFLPAIFSFQHRHRTRPSRRRCRRLCRRGPVVAARLVLQSYRPPRIRRDRARRVVLGCGAKFVTQGRLRFASSYRIFRRPKGSQNYPGTAPRVPT